MSAPAVEIPTIMTMIPLSLALCAICRSADLVIPCLTCERPQCEACFSKEDDRLRTCKGCRVEKELEMDWDPLVDPEFPEMDSESESEEEEEEEVLSYPPPPTLQPHLGYLYHPSHPNARPVEHLETGLRPFPGILYPSYDDWKHAETILVSHIHFTTSSMGFQPPRVDTRYLVGQMIHRFANHSTLTTDYMLCYEADLANPGRYVWQKYMSTYYNRSPIPYDENIFFPYPLPLAFHL
jgi:hypothetical protein